LNGGGDALPNRVRLERADGSIVAHGNGKLDGDLLQEGDVLVVESGGGGGYGPPGDRDRTALAEDVRHGYVTATAARRDYGAI
jgi:N-methylhydantoinase B